MTPLGDLAQPLGFESAVLALYLNLPETPLQTTVSDSQRARQWFDEGVPLVRVEMALLLGSMRRLLRPAQAPRLAPIRSLAYFQPVVEELLESPVSDGYRDYLYYRMRSYLRSPSGSGPPAPAG